MCIEIAAYDSLFSNRYAVRVKVLSTIDIAGVLDWGYIDVVQSYRFLQEKPYADGVCRVIAIA